MINVITVHWQTAKWVEVQLSYLERNVTGEYRVFAALNGIDDPELRKRFYFGEDLDGTHEEKLNAMAKMAIECSDPSDVLMFLDGDAFPVQKVDAWIEEALGSYPLAAVRRDENLADRQPHPCFCVTTAGFWQELDGDWRRGGTWINSAGKEVTDPGGNLLHQLEERAIAWLPLGRTNTDNPHPLWFAVYGHLVYHHGAGFRRRISRNDRTFQPQFTSSQVGLAKGPTMGRLRRSRRDGGSRLVYLQPRQLLTVARALQKTIRKRGRKWLYRRQKAQYFDRMEALADEVFAQLQTDPEFYRRFDNAAGEAAPDLANR
jgi:hypothetical protein